MLNARNAMVLVILLAVLSLVGVLVSLMLPPDSGGRGTDSYGTRAHGLRALYEILVETGWPVERGLVPPTGVVHREVTLLLWRPDAHLVDLEPAYLCRVADWVRKGGRVVVAPAHRAANGWRPDADARDTPQVVTALGLSDVAFRNLDAARLGPIAVETGAKSGASQPVAGEAKDEDGSKARWKRRRNRLHERTALPVRAAGSLRGLGASVRQLSVPRADLQVMRTRQEDQPGGRIYVRLADGTEVDLVAQYGEGRGRVVVVSDPALLANAHIAKADNAVLAAHLLARGERPVVFDEFYHGLTVRGNPAWILTQHPYGLLALLAVVVTGLWAWRAGVRLGPPLPDTEKQRRTIGEYVEAVAQLFQRGRCHAFVLATLRDGVRWALRRRMHLGPQHETVRDVARALARQDADAAARFRQATAQIDALLARRSRLEKQEVVRAAKEITACL